MSDLSVFGLKVLQIHIPSNAKRNKLSLISSHSKKWGRRLFMASLASCDFGLPLRAGMHRMVIAHAVLDGSSKHFC